MNIGKLLVLAAFAGAIVALFATERGKEIREDLEDTAEDWGDALSKVIEKASCSVTFRSRKLRALEPNHREFRT